MRREKASQSEIDNYELWLEKAQLFGTNFSPYDIEVDKKTLTLTRFQAPTPCFDPMIPPIKYIGREAFNGYNFNTLRLPNTLIGIEACAFVMCSLPKALEIPDSVKFIDSFAFDDCEIYELKLNKSNIEHFGLDVLLSTLSGYTEEHLREELNKLSDNGTLKNSFYALSLNRQIAELKEQEKLQEQLRFMPRYLEKEIEKIPEKLDNDLHLDEIQDKNLKHLVQYSNLLVTESLKLTYGLLEFSDYIVEARYIMGAYKDRNHEMKPQIIYRLRLDHIMAGNGMGFVPLGYVDIDILCSFEITYKIDEYGNFRPFKFSIISFSEYGSTISGVSSSVRTRSDIPVEIEDISDSEDLLPHLFARIAKSLFEQDISETYNNFMYEEFVNKAGLKIDKQELLSYTKSTYKILKVHEILKKKKIYKPFSKE